MGVFFVLFLVFFLENMCFSISPFNSGGEGAKLFTVNTVWAVHCILLCNQG